MAIITNEVSILRRIWLLSNLRQMICEFNKKEAPLTEEYRELENVLIKLLKIEATNLIGQELL